MKLNIKNSPVVIKSINCIFVVGFLSGCGSLAPELILNEPEVLLYDLNDGLAHVADDGLSARVDIVEESVTEDNKNADPSMDIENEFFFWAAEHVKTMDNMQLSFFHRVFMDFAQIIILAQGVVHLIVGANQREMEAQGISNQFQRM